MFKEIIEVYLLLSRNKKSYFREKREKICEKHEIRFKFDRKAEKIIPIEDNREKKAHVMSYYIEKDFDHRKKTALFFHTRRKFSEKDIIILKKHYNLIIFDFLGYAENYLANIKNKLGKYKIEHLIQQSQVILEDLEKRLEEKYKEQGAEYKREDHLILFGRSMGTIIATKLAAKLESEGKRCNKLINFVTPINANVAIKSTIKRYYQLLLPSFKELFTGFKKINVGTKYESSPAKQQFLASIAIITAITMVVASYIYFSYLIFNLCANIIKSKKNSTVNKVIFAILFISLIMIPSLCTIMFICDSKQVGITKEDTEKLKETPIELFALENDAHCTIKDLKDYFPNKNTKLYKILKSEHLTDEERKIDKQFARRDENGITHFIIQDPEKFKKSCDKRKKENEKFNEKLKNIMTSHTAFSLQDAALECVLQDEPTISVA